MVQSDMGDMESPLSGSTFINSKLEPWRNALHSSHSGVSRPSYAVAGLFWLNTTTTPYVFNFFDGTDDISIGTINATTNVFTPSGVVGLSDGDKGDITLSVGGTVWTIDSGVINAAKLAANAVTTAKILDANVTYAKIQDISATARVLGRKTAGAGVTEEVTLSQLLDFIGSAAQGDILYRGASSWARLAAGTSGNFLKTLGPGANPAWAAVPSLASFLSTAQSLAAGATLTLAHGLGVEPALLTYIIECTTAELGYSIGDRIVVNPGFNGSSGSDYNFTTQINATNIIVVISTAASFIIAHRTTRVLSAITLANWRLYVKAYA